MCFPTSHVSVEDVVIGFCLGELGIFPVETHDSDFKPRFHWTSPEGAYLLNEDWYVSESRKEVYGFPVTKGENCCCIYSISFQNLKPARRMFEFHLALYNNRV